MLQRPFRFAVFAYSARSGKEWAEKARRTEWQGYAVLVVPDHFLNELPPVPALAAAAAVTTTLRIGSIVFANDYRHPAVLAKDAATLDLLSDGRFEFGLGAGWLQKEYDRVGIRFDPAGVRIDRMVEAMQVVRGLWSEGPLDFRGEHYTIAALEGTPKPVQTPHPPMFIGGTGKRMLQVAALEADIVGLLPKTFPQGGHDWVGNTPARREEQVGWVREAAGERFADLELSCPIFRVIVTAHGSTVESDMAGQYGMTPDQMRKSPDFLIGSIDEIVEQLIQRRERFGISYVEIDEKDATGFAPVVARLAGR
jgi:probable F420-dependent oxidoreductase